MTRLCILISRVEPDVGPTSSLHLRSWGPCVVPSSPQAPSRNHLLELIVSLRSITLHNTRSLDLCSMRDIYTIPLSLGSTLPSMELLSFLQGTNSTFLIMGADFLPHQRSRVTSSFIPRGTWFTFYYKKLISFFFYPQGSCTLSRRKSKTCPAHSLSPYASQWLANFIALSRHSGPGAPWRSAYLYSTSALWTQWIKAFKPLWSKVYFKKYLRRIASNLCPRRT